MNIGEIISAFDVLQQQVVSPVQQLRKEIDLMRSELLWYERKYKDSDTTKRRERLQRLEVICKSLESCEPVSLMPLIREKLNEARRRRGQGAALCDFVFF